LELVDNQIDQTTAMIKLKAIFDNKDGMLWPGQFVNALLEVGLAKDAVVVPVGAIQRGQQGSFIWAVKSDGTAEPRPATIGQINNGLAIVQSGIAADEKVVISGHYRLQPGVRVTDTSTGGDAQK
jgi:multidrug efflux system membrane fusion protein